MEKRIIDGITGVYIVKPIKKTYLAITDKEHDGNTLFSKAIYRFTPHRSSTTGLIINGLTKEEATEFEQALGYEVGSLNAYNYQDAELKKKQGRFCWANYFIDIPKEGKVLNTDASDKDKLDYKLLKAFTKCAQSQAEVALDPTVELVLYSKEGEAKVEKITQDLKKNAYKKYAAMSLNDMMEFLNVFREGKFKVNKDSKPDIIDSEVGKIVDREPQAFLETVNNPLYKDMIFLSNCVASKHILKQGTKYMLQGGDVLGNNFLEAVSNLGKDDYNAVKVSLTAKLEVAK